MLKMSRDGLSQLTPREQPLAMHAWAVFLEKTHTALEYEADGYHVWVTGRDGELVAYDEWLDNPETSIDFGEIMETLNEDCMVVNVELTPLVEVL